MARAIAIDYWDKRCWIALEVEMIASSKEIILRVDIIKILEKYFLEYGDIDTIVVWLPYDLYWIDDTQLNKTKEFIRELENKFWKNSKSKNKFDIVWVDERFTSFEADNTLKMLWKKHNYRNKDDISAVLILETYLSNKKLW
jgi:putative transcription antitermination factor YqgF